MNKIVREHYPVEKLPEDLRQLVPGVAEVTIEVTVENESVEDTDAPPILTLDEAVAMMRQMQSHAAANGTTVTSEEAVRRVRELRDEWDD